MPDIYLGCSGYSYHHWRGDFYPEHLPQNRWFAHYQEVFSTVELNVTFYRTLKPETFRHWHEGSPPGFTFALKGSRFITHRKRLLEAESSLPRFFEPALELKEKLKVVLWQLPPTFPCDLNRLSRFLDLLQNYPVRHAFEFRHESWLIPEVIELCGRRKVALCMADAPSFLDELPITSDFVYLRRHGNGGHYLGEYDSTQLRRDADRILKSWAGTRRLHVLQQRRRRSGSQKCPGTRVHGKGKDAGIGKPEGDR